jgi:hypothetical protein
LDSVSRLRKEVVSLRHENDQLQVERDRLRRQLGHPGSSASNAQQPISNGYCDRISPGVQSDTGVGIAAAPGRPDSRRELVSTETYKTRHPFSGLTVTTSIEVSKAGQVVPVSTLVSLRFMKPCILSSV